MSVEARALLDRFFSAPNQIDVEQLPGEVASLVGLLLARAVADDRPRTVLPARVGGETRWYGMAQTASEGRQLREEMKAWIGAPVAHQVAQVAGGSSDELDRIALELAGPGGVAFVARVEPKYLRAARGSMQQLLSLWEIAPSREHSVPRPVGRVLRDFYGAILVRDRQAAEDALDEIRSRGLLTSTNVRFLLVELLGTLGTPEELRDESKLAQISLVTRPPRITEILAIAAAALFIEGRPVGDKTSIRRIADDLEEVWPGLVVHPVQVRSAASARCLALVESLPESPRQSVVSYLQSTWNSDEVVAAVLKVIVPPNHDVLDSDPLSLAAAGELEAAIGACESSSASPTIVGIAVLAASELGLAQFAERALRLLDTLPEESARALMSQAVQARRIAALRELTSEATSAKDWLDWLRSPTGSLGRLDLLMEWSLTIPMDRTTLTSTFVDELLFELIDALNDDRRPIVRNAVPILFASLTREGALRPEAVRLAIEIADVVLSSGAGSVERALALDIMDKVFECGCTADEYRQLLQAVGTHFGEVGPRSASFVADAVCLVLDSSAVDRDASDSLFARGLATVSRWLDRLDATDALVLEQVFVAVGTPMPARSARTDEVPSGAKLLRQVGIYSLEESGARRAASWISDLTDGAEVRLSHEHVNSDRLSSLVRGVDVMLVQTSKAAHAATHGIEGAALGQTPIVYVSGRGASSLLREFVRWVSEH